MTIPPTADSIPAIMALQRDFFASGATRDIGARIAVLDSFAAALEERQEAMLEALSQDLGKPVVEAFLAEYLFLIQEIRLIRKNLGKWLKPRRVGSPLYFLPCRSHVAMEPHGMVLVIAPWNYPVQLALGPMIAAIAAGNTVILKPSEMAPASGRFLRRIIADCFPPELATVITGEKETAEALLEQRFDFVFFTGSTAVGRTVAEKIAKHLTPHVLELGGKCPCVVDKSADLPLTARRILAGKLFNAGQTCFAPDFVAADDAVREDLAGELVRLLHSRPWEREISRIVNASHYHRLLALAGEDAIRKGEDDPDALHVAPRILPRTGWDHPAMKDEIFGPILPVVGYADHDELHERLRSLSTPLALYCFSRDVRFIDTLMARVPSGGVCINDTGKQAMNLRLPFGGAGDSGHGRYRGRSGVETFSRQRAVTRRYFVHDPFEMLPPRERATALLRKWLG